ncbi:MAG: NusG domain II-containing protein [Ignavibacteriales bacterium]|nr:NusG domain II-containing protein [Ignavibacteriales bacterium]
MLANIRNELKGRKASYVFSADYKESDLLSFLFKVNSKKVIVENEKGTVEEISLDKNYKNILIDGVRGKTGLEINNSAVHVHTSSCRHEICMQTIAHNSGDIIACAPNKVLVRIV